MFILFAKSFVLAFLGSFAPAMVLNIEKRLLNWASLGGAVGYTVALAFNPSSVSFGVIQILVGTLAVGVYSELMAKYLKAPATVFYIPGIFPLVPGIAAYQTMQSLVENKTQEAAINGLNTVISAFTIAFGIMIVTAVFRFMSKLKRATAKP
jgi:uncharacterized membrane protein YjjB (DUF3815 family)